MSPNRPTFDGRPIGSVGALARALGVEEAKLLRIAAGADRLYRGPIVIEKPGRKPREVFEPKPILRDIQQRILDRILRAVRYPGYLMGVGKGRGYIDNARRHASSRVLIGEDIDSFYPSIGTSRVQLIYQAVFHFPPPVARVLAMLATHEGLLVQGAITSTHLANLALHCTEPELEAAARRLGMTYSRFVDDVHISSPRPMAPAVMTRLVGATRGMLERAGFRPKRSKQFVSTPAASMRVHGLNVTNAVSVPRERRRQLRNGVFRLERQVAAQPWDAAIERVYTSLCARVGRLKHLNPGEGRRLKRRLTALRSVRAAFGGETKERQASELA